MGNGAGAAIFYREVVDAIARNPQGVGDLVVLRDLCIAVEANDKPRAWQLTRELLKLEGVEDPLRTISYELFHALLARLLLKGWFDEFELLLSWNQSWFGTKEEKVASKWEGVLKIVNERPESVGLLTRSNHEEEWTRALNGLEGALRQFGEVRLPVARMGAPPIEPAPYETALPRQLVNAIEHFFRLLQILFQQILELALARLEQDLNDTLLLRRLQRLQTTLEKTLWREDKPPGLTPPTARIDLGLDQTVRVAEVRYGGRGKQHRFLDAFPPFDSRSVIFNSLDREDKDEPYVRGEKIRSIKIYRDRQLGYFLTTYGHPWDPKEKNPGARLSRRRTLIQSKHGGRLKLRDNDDFVAFLSNYFEDRLVELTSQTPNAPPKAEASLDAWRETVDLWSVYLGQLSSHSRLNLTEGPPNYLTHSFPRNIGGRLLHDCGVYAVRSAYTLLSVLERIKRLDPEIAGSINARWVRFPLHVGLMIQSSNFGLVVEHNDHLFVIDNDKLGEVETEWLTNPPANDPDPADVDAWTLKFHEDVAASAFSSDLDMPVSSTPVLAPGEPVTTQTIWDSYQKKVVPTQLFTRLVGASNAPQYQFDTQYLKLSEQEREWYNEHVVKFWNKDCKKIWEEFGKVLTDPGVNGRAPELKKRKQEYADALLAALAKALKSYRDEILPKKRTLSQDLRADKLLLMPGIRTVASVRISTVLPVAEAIKNHLDEISRPEFKFPPDFAPPFARPEEELVEVP